MRRPEGRDYWERETYFIEREAEKDNPMGMFEGYCNMQKRFAEQDGFPELAQRIENAKRGKQQ
jgi:hypothetical protein